MRKFFVLSLILLLVLPQLVLAQNPCGGGGVTTGGLGKCITQIYKWSLGAAAILALLMVVLGGYKVMTAGGNAEQATSGKDYVLSALVGLALLFGAYLILNTINPDLVNFRDFSTTPPFTPPPAGAPRSP